MKGRSLLLLLTTAFAAFAACTPVLSVPDPSLSPTSRSRIPPEARVVVRLALNELARQLGVPAERLEVVSLTSVDWPDASLGCPQPGHLYAEVVTPGYRLFLTDGVRRYEFHTDMGQQVIRCP